MITGVGVGDGLEDGDGLDEAEGDGLGDVVEVEVIEAGGVVTTTSTEQSPNLLKTNERQIIFGATGACTEIRNRLALLCNCIGRKGFSAT